MDSSEEYLLALGRFIARFSAVEQHLHGYLWMIADVGDILLRALLPDTRVGSVTGAINRINESRGDAGHPLYLRAIDQLGKINRMRNDIVHVQGHLTDKGLLLSNIRKALPRKALETTVTTQMLDDMSEDLRTISACVAAIIQETTYIPPGAKPLPWAEIAQRPWRYKQPQPSSQANKTPPHDQA